MITHNQDLNEKLFFTKNKENQENDIPKMDIPLSIQLTCFKDICKPSRESVFQGIKDGLSITLLPTEFLNDREIIKEAVKINGLSITLAPKKYRKSREIMLMAISKNPELFQLASDELKKNHSFLIDAYRQNGKLFTYIPKDLQNSKFIWQLLNQFLKNYKEQRMEVREILSKNMSRLWNRVGIPRKKHEGFLDISFSHK